MDMVALGNTDFTYESGSDGVYLRVAIHDANDLKSAFEALEERLKLEKKILKVE